jgi:LytS/YehU family sensor histidine kinase
MRYHKKIDIQFNTYLEDNNIKVMPLLFIILLENAFKHGVENLRDNAFIHIDITSKNKEVLFQIENNFDENTLPEKSGIGIKNLKRRLDLAYPKNHSLIFTNVDSVYNVRLQLQQ